MKKFLLKFSDSLLSKEEIRSVKGGYGETGGPIGSPTFTLWCANPGGGSSHMLTGGGCPSYSTANALCAGNWPGTIESSLYCS
jgi:hypothetical protein